MRFVLRRHRNAGIALFLSGLITAVSFAEAKSAACGGKDMLAELQATDSAAYAQVMAQSEATENTEAMLWKVERPGAATSYLFGTVHLTDDRVTTLSPAFRKALDEVQTVALEVADLSEDATVAAMAGAADLLLFTDGRRLDKLLTPDEYEKVKTILSKSGMPGDLASTFKPWIVSMILSVPDCERKQAESGKPVLDAKVAEAARAKGATVAGLETLDSQLAALAAIPDGQQLDMLRAGLKYADRTDDMMETLLQLYLNRRMGAAWPFQVALAGKAGIGPQSFTGFEKGLIVDRNHTMRDAALPLLEKGGVMVAVGALHLPGKDGLVALLRTAGYTVTPVE